MDTYPFRYNFHSHSNFDSIHKTSPISSTTMKLSIQLVYLAATFFAGQALAAPAAEADADAARAYPNCNKIREPELQLQGFPLQRVHVRAQLDSISSGPSRHSRRSSDGRTNGTERGSRHPMFSRRTE
ncbi:uncharacterized protein MYCGRDRAFT_91909 [Zymoseptoria tritici IPO323]|uniref:Uncharacterized protein n=1 Tax=Zymoseptoria tritici (strain CBS 115943 / IPO323) TaxID=336722 RepID=F9X7D9_ZYMTI|nr:uncharacterized protein MYCGRDRAFT_91909 [Zymoseptoria tritici IPO323]EGP88941.1 hypothetical protein MYCGRDRAFT_91909 [Zymoseptoria tritici IPO323]